METIKKFLDADISKLEEIISKHPKQIPCHVIADYVGSDVESIRTAVNEGFLGIKWRKPGKLTGGNCIPTAKFVRWILNQKVM